MNPDEEASRICAVFGVPLPEPLVQPPPHMIHEDGDEYAYLLILPLPWRGDVVHSHLPLRDGRVHAFIRLYIVPRSKRIRFFCVNGVSNVEYGVSDGRVYMASGSTRGSHELCEYVVKHLSLAGFDTAPLEQSLGLHVAQLERLEWHLEHEERLRLSS